MKAADLSRHYNPAIVVWLKAKLLIPTTNIVDVFIGCDFCSGKVNAPEGLTHNCMHCGKEKSLTIKRFKLGVTVADESGEVNAVMFSYEVEKLLSICRVPNNDGDIDMAMLTERLKDITFIVGLKKNTKTNSAKSEFSLVMTSLENVQQLLTKFTCEPMKQIGNASSSVSAMEQPVIETTITTTPRKKKNLQLS